jgi:hypothetical protein
MGQGVECWTDAQMAIRTNHSKIIQHFECIIFITNIKYDYYYLFLSIHYLNTDFIYDKSDIISKFRTVAMFATADQIYFVPNL